MERRRELIKLFVPLLAAVYLGFYAFGLVMGAFSPIESIALTIGAAICMLGLLAYAIARRHGIEPVPASSPIARAARARRERRGW